MSPGEFYLWWGITIYFLIVGVIAAPMLGGVVSIIVMIFKRDK